MYHCDSLLVLSTEGNGGTKLLCSTLKQMIENESECIIFSGNKEILINTKNNENTLILSQFKQLELYRLAF